MPTEPQDLVQEMFACYAAVSLINPLLLWCGAQATSAIFGFSSRWQLGVFMAAALVGAAGIITIVTRQRKTLTGDIAAITVRVLLGFVAAPILGLAVSATVAVAIYAYSLVVALFLFLCVGRWQTPFLRTVSWPVIWSLLALFFAFIAYKLILYQ